MSKKKKQNVPANCCLCGKFIKYEEIEMVNFIPDSPFGPEQVTFQHNGKKCKK